MDASYPCMCGCEMKWHRTTTVHMGNQVIKYVSCENCFPMYDEPGPSREGCNAFRPDNLKYLEQLSETKCIRE